MTEETILLRQVHPSFLDNGEATSQAFFPFPKDKGLLSVDDGDLTTAAAAFTHFTEKRKLESAGTWGVSCAEVKSTELDYRSDPVAEDKAQGIPANPAHAVIDFGARDEKACRKLARKLKAYANTRKRLHPAA
jgi:hypothetical protein